MKLISILSIFSLNLLADYRVYQYLVKNKMYTQQTSSPLLRTSTLDPVSFLAYNGGANAIEVNLLRTWRCPGNTSKKQLCPSPYSEINLNEVNNVKN